MMRERVSCSCEPLGKPHIYLIISIPKAVPSRRVGRVGDEGIGLGERADLGVGETGDNNGWLNGTDRLGPTAANHPFLSCIRCGIISTGDQCPAVKVKKGYSPVYPS